MEGNSVRNQAFEQRLFKLSCGAIFVAECSEEEDCFKYYCQQKLVQQLLPKIYYKPYKRKNYLETCKIIRGVKLFLQTFYRGCFVPTKETAAYFLGYEENEISEITFYVPIAKNENYCLGNCKLHLLRKDRGNYLYSLEKAATIVELFRHIGPYSFNRSVREKISKLISKKQINLLLKNTDVPKWMQKELKKILKIKEFQEEEKR